MIIFGRLKDWQVPYFDEAWYLIEVGMFGTI